MAHTSRTAKTRIQAGISGGAPRTEKPEHRLLKVRWERDCIQPAPAVRGSVLPWTWGCKG